MKDKLLDIALNAMAIATIALLVIVLCIAPVVLAILSISAWYRGPESMFIALALLVFSGISFQFLIRNIFRS